MSNSSVRPIDRTLSGITTPDKSEPGSKGNEGLLRIPQSLNVTGASPIDYLVSYPEHSLVESHHSAEMQSVYSTSPTEIDKKHVWTV